MWYGAYVKLTGELYSIGTELANPIPKQFGIVELGEDFNTEGLIWNSKILAFEPEPQLQILTREEYINNLVKELGLTTEQKTKLNDLIK